MKKDDRERCLWATTELYKEYHDEEWGKPVHDDRKLFEMLVLEGMQAGLSWQMTPPLFQQTEDYHRRVRAMRQYSGK